ncbi:MAG: nucleotidyltransferase domain-containing protein [Armatimonadota bacterium]
MNQRQIAQRWYRQQDSLVRQFVEQALPRLCAQLKPKLVLLFGSRARGTAREDSDLDIIVVSQAFEGMHFLKRMPFVLRLVRFPRHVDLLCYTPAEFEQIQQVSSIVREAMREGVVLYQAEGSLTTVS